MSTADLLAELLSELFDEGSLRRFVRSYRQGRAISKLLADQDELEDVEDISYFIVQEWDDRNLIDEELQDRLISSFSEYEQSIKEVFDEILEDDYDDFDAFGDEDESDDYSDDDDDDDFDDDDDDDDEFGLEELGGDGDEDGLGGDDGLGDDLEEEED